MQETTSNVQAEVEEVKAGVNDVLANQRNDRQRILSEEVERKLSEALRSRTIDEIAQVHKRMLKG